MTGGVRRLGEITTIVGSFFMDEDETPITFVPTSVTVTVRKPSGTETTLANTSPLMLHHTLHEWYLDVTLDERGRWEADWLCVGSFTDGNGDVRAYREPIAQVVHVYA